MTAAPAAAEKRRNPFKTPMARFIYKRVLTFIPIMLIMSLLIFFIIQLPPGDYLTTYIAGMKAEGIVVDEAMVAGLKEQYGLDQPWYVQYLKWMWGILTRFDFGYSFEFGRPVWPVIADVLPMTIVVSLATMLFFSSMHEAEEDPQGRVVLPTHLKTAAGIDKDIVTVGRGKRIEIWAADVYKKISADVNYKVEFKKLGI